jgi:diaminopimelate decarboxylase
VHYFEYHDGELFCEDVPLEKIAAEIGTPVYVYSEQTLARHVRVFDEAFQSVPHLICYAVKANSNLTILKRFAAWGLGFDIVSAGELFRIDRAGASTRNVIFSGVGKTASEVRYALESDILFFNIESVGEIEMICEVARDVGKRARVSIRTNPGIDPRTHPYISTGLKKNKFGVAIDEAKELYRRIGRMPEIEVVGVACHIGSQITEIEPFREALAAIRQFVLDLQAEDVSLRFLDFGGGLGINYKGEEPPSPATYAASIIDTTRDLNLTLVLEPGRVIVGNAGILLTRVLLKKQQGEKRFVIVDAGMNDLIRPALYGSHHQIWPVHATTSQEVADVVGPVCESADFIAQEREVPVLERDDLLAVMSAGAYGFTLSSNYNSRPRVAEVLVRKDRYSIIRRRENYDDLVRLELP